MNHHFVQHFLRSGDYVQTEFTCTAPENAGCRVACKTCNDEHREQCECEFGEDESGEELNREPNLVDFGECLHITWLTNDAPEEMYNGERAPVRGPGPQPIALEWDGDGYGWDYAT